MQVRFRSVALRRCYERTKEGRKVWGDKIARKYVERLNILYAVESGVVLSTLPQLHFHPLAGARTGQYALNLDEFWRLVISFDDSSQRQACVEEVSKHYDD
jgi:proteic killer suppression protein